MSEDQIAESLVREAAAGRYGAYGEIGDMPAEADFTADERKVYRAVGKAHLKNNLPIFTHNNYGTGPDVPREIALRQLDVYESVGVNARRIAIGHMDSLPGKDPDIMKALARRGAFVGIDRIRGEAKADEDRVALILGFLEAGYSDRLLLSSDTRRDYSRVARFVDAFFGKFDQFLQPPRHPKWREVNLTAEVPGWTRFQASQDWLAQHAKSNVAQDTAQARFAAFLSDAKVGTNLSDTAKEELFRQFLAWDKQRQAVHQ